MPLSRLAGHTAEFASLVTVILTRNDVDYGTPSDPRRILRMETRDKLLADFDELAAGALEAMRATDDETLMQTWRAFKKAFPPFPAPLRGLSQYGDEPHDSPPCAAGVYLRLLGLPVPSTFGPTADEAA